jgi:hypothetical protein
MGLLIPSVQISSNNHHLLRKKASQEHWLFQEAAKDIPREKKGTANAKLILM